MSKELPYNSEREITAQINEIMKDFRPTETGEIKDEDLRTSLEYINKYSGGRIEVEEVEKTDGLRTRMQMYREGNSAGITPGYEGIVPKDRLKHFLHKLHSIDYDEVGLRGVVMLEDLRANWETFLEERQGKYDQIVEGVASRLHDQWRAPRKIKNREDFEPRWKDPEDEEFVGARKDKLKPGETKGSVRMTEEGNIEIDIANTDFNGLTPKWQKENKASAQVAVYEIMKMLNFDRIAGLEKRILPQSLDVSSEAVHRAWLKRNPWGEKDAIIRLPFHIMKQVGKGRIDNLDTRDFLARIAEQIERAVAEKGSSLNQDEIDRLVGEMAPKHAVEELEKDRDVTKETIERAKEAGIIDDKTIH